MITTCLVVRLLISLFNEFLFGYMYAISLIISSLENYLKIEKQKENQRELQPR